MEGAVVVHLLAAGSGCGILGLEPWGQGQGQVVLQAGSMGVSVNYRSIDELAGQQELAPLVRRMRGGDQVEAGRADSSLSVRCDSGVGLVDLERMRMSESRVDYIK